VATHCAAQDGLSNIEFVQNRGQWDPQVNFKGEVNAGAFFLHKQGFTALLHNPGEWAKINENHGGLTGPAGKNFFSGQQAAKNGEAGDGRPVLHSHAYRVRFVGSNEQVEIIPDKPLPSYNNYFIGNDPTKWASDCKIYQGVTYKNIYPDIDIRYYSDNGQMKYDIIVHPGGDVGQIAMKYEGVDQLAVKKNELLINTSVGQAKERVPSSYLFDANGKKTITCKYVIRDGNTVRFKVDSYAPGSTLIIDPQEIFCSFTGSRASNWGFTATPGPDGSFFAGGIVFGAGFPVTTGVQEPNFRGGDFDVGIMRFTSNGSARMYATYLGGADAEAPHSMITDAQGNLIVLGRTYSTDFPFKTKAGNPAGGSEMFVAKLNGNGSNLIGCMLIGGTGNDCVNMEDQLRSRSDRADSLLRNYGDDSRSEVILDGANNIIIAASTQSTDFPVTPGVFQPNFGGGRQDGVVLKINPDCNAIIWSSFLGGTGSDAAFVLKPNLVTGDIYVAGATASLDFPGDKTGTIQGSYQGGICDAFVTVISSDGKKQGKTTYLGTGSADAIYGIQIDKKGFPYVMGTTNGFWKVVNALYVDAGARQFVSKLKPDLSDYVYSTTFGTPTTLSNALPNISPVAFLVDRCENVYISGWGGWIFPAADPFGLSGPVGMRTTSDAIKKVSDNRDFYFVVLKKNVTDILYGTFFGQEDNAHTIGEHVDGGTSRYDQNGIIYQAICANCNGGTSKPFPTTPGVWGPKNGTGSAGCNLAAIKIAFNFAGVSAGLRTTINGHHNDTSGCIPLDATLEDTVRNAKSYIWSFGDGSPDTATTGFALTHTYTRTGVYLVRLIAIDSSTCNVADTVYTHIIARNDKAPLDFTYAKTPGTLCTDLDYIFINLSTFPPGKPFQSNSFIWDFGDQTGQIPAGLADVNHTFKSTGTYIVSLTLADTNYCNYPDAVSKTLRISPVVKAQFTTPAAGCVPYSIPIDNTSLGGQDFQWDFGDGGTSTDPIPTHIYTKTGTYTITLIANDTNTCNKTDTTHQTITVSDKPVSGFSYSPIPPVANTPIVFTNGSSGGIRYKWIFGDGSSETKTTMDTAKHLYNRTDTFNACLVVFNQYECTDTVCHPVATLIHPLLDVPNAFTPGRFGENGIIRVMGFGITHMTFRIYNRWGQLVFQTNDPNQGWDGTYNGILQPMEVYGYTLEAEFSNGNRTNKKGDITLIR